jgi:hypothetical protein
MNNVTFGLSVKIYILLNVYDYDYSNRYRMIKHFCNTEIQARKLYYRLSELNGINVPSEGRTGRWLGRNHGISGFIFKIEGIFKETTEML